MSSSTVLRVKRRLEDSPEDALVLMCKRKKAESEANLSASLFVFCGTVENQENHKVKSIIPKTELKMKPEHKVEDIVKKLRADRKEVATESRYEIVNLSRGLTDDSNELQDAFDLVDLEAKAKAVEEDDSKYIFDVYMAASQDFDVFEEDNLISIEHVKDEGLKFYYTSREDGHASTSSEHSDDSNDENNWRNDYPDSDHSSIQEEDLVKAVQRCDIDSDLSSDDERDIYDDPYLFSEDVTRFGPAYAKYKAKVLNELPPEPGTLVHSVAKAKMDEESVDGYKSDSDGGFYYGEEGDADRSDRDSLVSDPD